MPVKSVQMNVLSNSKAAKADLQDVSREADKLGAKVVKVRASVDDQTAGPFNVIERKVQRANGQSVIIRVKADDADADVKLDNIERKIKALDGKEAKVQLKVGSSDLEKASAMLAGFDKIVTLTDADAGKFAKVMAAVNLATGIAEPVVAGLTVGVLALGSSLVAGGLGLGAFGLALLGPIKNNKQLKSALTDAENAVFKWGDSLAKFTMPPIFAALKLVNPLLKDMSPFVKAAASAIDVLIGQLSKGVGSSGFAGWLKSELPLVKPSIVNLGDSVGHVIMGIMGIFHAFNPSAVSMSKGLDDITAKFEKWGQQLGSSSGFQKLMDMFHSDTPVVMNDLSKLGGIIVHVGSDMADMNTFANSRSIFQLAGFVLTLVNALAKAHPELVTDALYTLAFLDAVKKLSAGLGQLKEGVTTLHSVGSAVVGLGGNLSNMKKGMNDSEVAASEASGAWGTFGGKIGTVKTGLSNFKGGMNDAEVATSDASGVMGTLGGKLSVVGSSLVSFGAAIFKVSTYTKIWTGVQAALDVVMDANPVILIAAAIVVLIGVIVLLAVKFKPVRDFFIAAWKDILVAAQAVWGWLKANWPLLLEIIGGPIAVAAVQIYKHFSDIKAWAFDAWAWIKNNWPYLAGALFGPIGIAAAAIYKHFSDIEQWAKDVWNWIRGNWGAIENWIESPIRAAVNVASSLLGTLKNDFSNALSWIKSLFSSMWSGIEGGFRSAIGTLGTILRSIEGAFSTPIKFVVNDIWDPMAGLFNKVSHFIGFTLPTLHMAEGGLVGGIGHKTQDANLVALSRGETVISAQTSQIIAPTLRAYGVPGYAHGGGRGGDPNATPRKIDTALLPSGGIQDSFAAGFKWTEGELAKLANFTLKQIADAVFAPINALLGHIPGTPQVANMLENMIKSVLSALVGDIKNKATASAATLADGPAGGATGSEMANGKELYNYLLSNVFGGHKIAAAGATASIWGESTWNPFAQGTGGRGLIGWTPPGTISNADFSGGMKTQLPAIIRFIQTSGDEGVIREMMSATSVLQAANEWGKGVERYGINDVHSTGLSLAAGFMGQAAAPSAPKGGVSTSPVTGEQSFNGYSYGSGGMIREPVIGQGLFSGAAYRFAENGPERVLPNSASGGGDTYYITVAGDSDPDGAALRIIQKVRDYKRHHGNQPTNIG